MKNSNPSQEKQILSYLQKGNKLTSLEALRKFGCFRLSARVYALRKQNIDINSKMVKRNKKHVKEYFI